MTAFESKRVDPLLFGEVALRLRSERHQLLAGNIINADTPNYLAKDIDFKRALQDQLNGLTKGRLSLPLNLTSPRHLQVEQRVSVDDHTLYRLPVQPSVDGNTVDPDLERSQFEKNAVFLESTLAFLNSSIRTQLTAITGQLT